MTWLPNRVFFDTSSLQYAPWRAFVTLFGSGVEQYETMIGGYDSDGVQDETTYVYVPKEFNFYYFDAVFKTDHVISRTITDNPVQDMTYAPKFSYQQPAKISLEIGMSDVMSSIVLAPKPGEDWGTSQSQPPKSVSAYQQLVDWQEEGELLTIGTRLTNYKNMVIESIQAPDDYKTQFGLKCFVSLQQLLLAETVKTKVSVNQQVLDANALAHKDAIKLSEVKGVLGALESYVIK